jgi:PAS domain S-box-containing protein
MDEFLLFGALRFDQKILLASGAYLGLLFLVAWLADHRKLPDWLVDNPVVQVLSFGVFASAWTFYGVVDFANQYGYGVLSYSMGVGGLFVFTPLLLMPLFRLSRTYQLHSLADLLVFRFRSPWVGVLATFCMILSALPLLALQIKAVADTALILSYRPQTDRAELFALHEKLGLAFCFATFVFAAMFGAHRERHRGLVAAMAFESVVKLVTLMAVGLYALFGVFGGPRGLEKWLTLHPEQIETLYQPLQSSGGHILVTLFFATAVVLPNMFQMVFTENTRMSTLRHASWGMPLYLLGLSLPVLPILWAGFELGSSVTPEYFTLGVPLAANKARLTALAYMGGLSAAAGTMVVMSLALSTMCLNHWLLPLFQPKGSKANFYGTNLYGLITWLRRIVLGLIILASYGFYVLVRDQQTLSELAILAFIEALQFLPPVFSVLYGHQANYKGMLAALCVGTLIWFFGLMLPMLLGWHHITIPGMGWTIPVGMQHWTEITVVAFLAHIALLSGVSRFTTMSLEEQRAAEQCSMDEVARPLRLALDVQSAEEMGARLAPALGAEIAQTELDRALKDLQQALTDARPYALRRLRDRLEANLSGLMGAAVAHTLMDRLVPYHTEADAPLKEDVHFVENRLNQYRHHLTGMAAELDNLRRHHRQTLESLPMAVCSFGTDGEVLLWNRAMESLTGIDSASVMGSSVGVLPFPWGPLMDDFLRHAANSESIYPEISGHSRKQKLELNGHTRWLNVHKADMSRSDIEQTGADGGDGIILMIEDLTETERLEQELLHSERLASIGRLAAGVAHEVGNPVTGIACLAQNLKYDSDEPEVVDTATQILGQTDRITRIVQSLVHFAHAGSQESGALNPVDLFECVEEAIHLLSLQKDRTRVHYNNLMAPDTLVLGEEQKLTQLFINLFSNARDVSPSESPIDISATIFGDKVRVHVRDYGHGISPHHMARIFEPFFTTKPAGQGTGLGLALVYSIVEEHGGQIDVISPVEEGTGTEFVITLPLVPEVVG